jgi:hypothetical protein
LSWATPSATSLTGISSLPISSRKVWGVSIWVNWMVGRFGRFRQNLLFQQGEFEPLSLFQVAAEILRAISRMRWKKVARSVTPMAPRVSSTLKRWEHFRL